MSSTYTRQTPVHTYGHPQREPQPYLNYNLSPYAADSKSLADDVNSYAHTQDFYHPGCVGYVPYDPEYSQSEETEEDSGCDPHHIQNNNYASPQLLSPRPTLPPSSSQFSPHFSWYDWPCEAPANVYQAEQTPRYTNSTSHLVVVPPAGEIQHSFGNQQPEFAVPVPNLLASNHIGDGYNTQQFEASLDRSTHFNFRSGFYYSAHQPVSPEQHSSYSELAPNLKFLNSQTPAHGHKGPSSHTRGFSTPQPDTTPKGTISSSPDIQKNPFGLGFDGPPLTAFGRKVPPKAPTRSASVSLPAPFNTSKRSDKAREPRPRSRITWDCPG